VLVILIKRHKSFYVSEDSKEKNQKHFIKKEIIWDFFFVESSEIYADRSLNEIGAKLILTETWNENSV